MELKLGFSWAVVCYHFVLIVLYGIETVPVPVLMPFAKVLIVLYGIETLSAAYQCIAGIFVLIVLYGIETEAKMIQI